jgi:hypothetical protein
LTVAVIFALCAVVTALAVAAKPVLAAFAATVTVEGSVIAGLLLANVTTCPPLPATAFSVTVQASLLAPVMDALLHVSAPITGNAVPLSAIVAVAFVDEVLVMVSCALAVPDDAGLNCKLTVVVCPGFNVMGKLPPEILKPFPVTVAAFTVTGTLPVDVSVTVCELVAFTRTLPKATLPVLIVSVGVAAFSCRAKLFVAPFALAVTLTACAVLTELTAAVNAALVAPDETVTAPGNVTAALLLDKPTAWPALGAAEFSVTVQASVAAPVIDALLQEIALTTAVPVPASAIVVVGVPFELLPIVNCPVASPAAVGANCTLSVAACDGVSVSGKVAPDKVNPLPVTAAVLITTGTFPVEVKVIDCDAELPTCMLPKATLLELAVSVAIAAFNCNAKVLATPFALAVSVAVWAEVTAVALAVKASLVAPAAIVTAAGSVTAVLLVDNVTVWPALGAAVFKVTVQATVADPVSELLAQETALTTAKPVPASAVTVVGLAVAVLFSVS